MGIIIDLSLFPNFIIGTYYPNQIGVYLNIPIGPGITSQKRIIYSTEGKSMSKEEIDITKKIWWSVHKEDHEMCERLQEGRSSPASNDGGLLSPHWEKGVQKFQKLKKMLLLLRLQIDENPSYLD